MQIKITEPQLDILRATLGELCYAFKFQVFQNEIKTDRQTVLEIYNKINIAEESLRNNISETFELENILIKRENSCLFLLFSRTEFSILATALTIVMRELDEWEFPIRTGHEFEEAKKLLIILHDTQ
jgi:hypothetical protein